VPPRRIASSFRDPSGHVYEHGDRILRSVRAPGRDDFEFVRDTGFLDQKVKARQVIEAQLVPNDQLGEAASDACYTLEHPRLGFISHPYEWSFWGLRAAALLTLELHRDALQHGISMSDASAFNVQFDGPNPLLIDYLSFRRYQEGELWAGHRQFCEQFLYPLLLTAHTGVPFNQLMRGRLNGIPAAELSALLPALKRLAPRILLHVGLPARAGRGQSTARVEQLSRARLPKAALTAMLEGMHSWISALQPARRQTAWQSYAAVNTYSEGERGEKARFVAEFVSTVRPDTIWDLGCNTGDYARVALEAGARQAIGFEFDQGALDAAFQRAQREQLRFLPLHQDLLNPSPDQGWRESERKGLGARTGADAVLMLALVHHLAIANNVPLVEVVDWATSLAPAGVIEFVPKEDPMTAALLALRKDIFPDYTRDSFLAALRQRATVTNQREITGTGRLLVSFQRL
jgi:ribosomal protein L11 methylase PrmA